MEELYYLAGLIDGEGTITLIKSKSSDKFRSPIVSITSTTWELMIYLHQNYGGHVCKQKVYQDHHKQSWSWRLRHKSALDLCSKLYPLLKEPNKAYRAYLLSQVYPQVTLRNGKYSQEQFDLKLKFEDAFFHPSTPLLKALGAYESLASLPISSSLDGVSIAS